MIADRPLSTSIPTPVLGVPIAVSIDAQQPSDIKVYYDEDRQTAVLDSDYTLSIAGDFKSCTITPLAGLITKAAGDPITIAFDAAIVQTWDIPNSPSLPETRLEQALDRLTLFVRRAQERLLGSLRQAGGVWQGEGLKLIDLIDGEDDTDAATVGQVRTLVAAIASGDFENNALLVSYAGTATGNNVATALDGLANALDDLSDTVDGLAAGFLSGGLLTGALDLAAIVAVDSATTTDLGAVASNRVQVNGVVEMTSFGAGANKFRIVYHNGAHNVKAGASLIPPGAVDRLAAAGDVSIWTSNGTAVWKCVNWFRTSGRPITALVADVSDMSANARTFNQAANYAAMRTALGLGALAVLGFDGLIYAGSSNSNTSFPIGTIVAAQVVSGTEIVRNASNAIRIDDGTNYAYVVNAIGAGAALSGTWRARGFSGAGSDHYQLFQRVA